VGMAEARAAAAVVVEWAATVAMERPGVGVGDIRWG